MTSYLVKIEGTSHEISAAGNPAWAFSVTRAVKAKSEAEAKTVAIARVAREWAAVGRSGRGLQPYLKVAESCTVNPFIGWWRGRGGFIFHAADGV